MLQSTRAVAATASWRVPVCEQGDDLNDAGPPPVGVVGVSELEQAHSAQSAVGANRRRIVEGAMRIMIPARER